jgi:hypothetical protein
LRKRQFFSEITEFFQGSGARMAEDNKPGPWVEIWEQCEHYGGSGIEAQTHVGLREACNAGCNRGKLRKLITVNEFHDLLHASKEH